MKNRLCSFLRRLALSGLAALMPLILWSPALALADTINVFDVSGTATNVSGGSLDSCAVGAVCGFSGTFQVDVTTGDVVSPVDFTFPGLPDFVILGPSGPSGPNWVTFVANSAGATGDTLELEFTTGQTPPSLVGFTGGSIVGGTVFVENPPSFPPLYTDFTGSITPVPEPSSLLSLAGALGWLAFGFIRRRFEGLAAEHDLRR